MRRSLNEIELHLRRAALGCGVPPGCAEDFGAATAWLCAQGFEGVPPAVAELEDWLAGRSAPCGLAAGPPARLTPSDDKAPAAWHLGPAVADLLRAGTTPLQLGTVARPQLLLGALGVFSAAKGPGLLLRWPAGTALCRNGVPYLVEGAWEALGAPLERLEAAASDPRCRGARRSAPPVLEEGVTVDPAVWARVQALVRRTLVPASEGSRARGAGAGLVDAD
jgi:hypothetical protein